MCEYRKKKLAGPLGGIKLVSILNALSTTFCVLKLAFQIGTFVKCVAFTLCAKEKVIEIATTKLQFQQ